MKPTLEELKEYFKNAKIIEDCSNGLKYKINWDNVYLSSYGNWCLENTLGNICYLWSKDKYANIIEYKKDVYELTKEQLLSLKNENNEKKLQAMFPELFFKTPKYEVHKWYKSCVESMGKLFCFNGGYDEDSHPLGYGILSNGTWMEANSIGWGGMFKEASKEEILEALTKEAIKRGFKEGTYIHRPFSGDLEDCVIDRNNFPKDMNYYYNLKEDYLEHLGFVIYSKGQWAEIIPSISKEEAERRLNIKII